MWDWGDVFDDTDFEADGLDGADGGFTTGTWAFDADFDFFEAVTHGLAAGVLGDHLGGVGGAFAGAFEATLASAGPTDGSTIHVGDGDDGIIERGDDVSDARVDIFAPLGLDDFDLLNNGVGIEREVLLFLGLGGGGRCGLFLFASARFYDLGSLDFGGWSSWSFGGRGGLGDGRGWSYGFGLWLGGWSRFGFGHKELEFTFSRLPWRVGRRRSCEGPCGCGHWSGCVDRGREGYGGGECLGSS